MERGPVEEVLMNIGAFFCSEVLREPCEKWGVKQYFRSAYRQSGNRIIERNHRTIKAVAERSQISPQVTVFWYNMAPKNGRDETSVPHKSVFTYEWRHPLARMGGGELGQAKIAVGEEMWVKPPNPHCTT